MNGQWGGRATVRPAVPRGTSAPSKGSSASRATAHSSAPHARDTFPTMQEIPKLRASSALSRTPSLWIFFQKSLGETRMVIKCGLQGKLEGEKNHGKCAL